MLLYLTSESMIATYIEVLQGNAKKKILQGFQAICRDKLREDVRISFRNAPNPDAGAIGGQRGPCPPGLRLGAGVACLLSGLLYGLSKAQTGANWAMLGNVRDGMRAI